MPATLQTMRSGATAHPEEIVNFITSRLVKTGGVVNKTDGGFLCEELAVPDMHVNVNQGYALIPKSDNSMCYPVRLHAGDYSAVITSNASGNPRIDAIVLYIDLAATADATATNVAKIAVVAGTPAASPTAPTDFAIGSAIGASNPFIRLANVTVASGASEILDADISDQRPTVEVNQDFNMDDIIGAYDYDSIIQTFIESYVFDSIIIRYLTVDGTKNYSGVKQSFTAGENFVLGEVGYIKSDGKIWKADADAEATMPGAVIATGTINANNTGTYLLIGTIKNASWSLTIGGKVYTSTAAGAITQTPPSGTDDCRQLIGIATASDRIFFKPDLTYTIHV